jgi:hypothetical protein
MVRACSVESSRFPRRPHCYNTRSSILHHFVGRPGGLASHEDVVPATEGGADRILDHVPPASRPRGLTPFSVRHEKAAFAGCCDSSP